MQIFATLLVAACVLLHVVAWPVPFSLSRASSRAEPRLGSRRPLLSSVEAARAYLEETETEFLAFTAGSKVAVSHTISNARARAKSGVQAALTTDRKEMTAEMRQRFDEWMRILGEERCGDRRGCE